MEKSQIKFDKSALTGVIDIGSGFTQLKIAYQHEGKLQILESVTKTLPIGRETFSEGRISPEMMRSLSKVLLGFRQLLREYKVRRVRVVATGAIREAKNREYVIDQIKASTGYTIEIMNGSEERLLTQMAVRRATTSYEKLKKEELLIVNIGSGGVQVAAYIQGKLCYSQNIRMGALRIRQILSSLEIQTVEYTKILEEYIDFHVLEVIEPMKERFRHLVITGEEVDSIYRICSNEHEQNTRVIDQRVMRDFYERLLYMSVQQIADEFTLSFERAEMLMPTLMLMRAFARASNAKKIFCPSVGLSSGILYDMNRNKEEGSLEEEILHYARFIAEQYTYAEKHVEAVRQSALFIFDHLGRHHHLTKRHRLLLEMGAILHDIGKSIHLVKHPECGAALLAQMDLMGISSEEQHQLVIMLRYHESGEPKSYDEDYKALSKKARMAVSKLLAILQMANSLDFSHKQKLYDLSAKLEGEAFVIRANTKENSMLEEWIFGQNAGLFREVFGLEPKLKVRSRQVL